MKAKELVTYIAFIIIIIVMAILNKNELLEVKERYEVVQEEKEYLIKENNDLKQKLLEQDMKTNNKDTRE